MLLFALQWAVQPWQQPLRLGLAQQEAQLLPESDSERKEATRKVLGGLGGFVIHSYWWSCSFCLFCHTTRCPCVGCLFEELCPNRPRSMAAGTLPLSMVHTRPAYQEVHPHRAHTAAFLLMDVMLVRWLPQWKGGDQGRELWLEESSLKRKKQGCFKF